LLPVGESVLIEAVLTPLEIMTGMLLVTQLLDDGSGLKLSSSVHW
jgi:hypothetical protein